MSYFRLSKLKKYILCLQPIIIFLGVQFAVFLIFDVIPLSSRQWIQHKLNANNDLFGVLISNVICGFIFYRKIRKDIKMNEEVKETKKTAQITYSLIIKILFISLVFQIISGELIKGFQYISGIDLMSDYAFI